MTEIEYDLTPEDLLAYQRYQRQNPPEPRRGGNATGAVFAGVVFGIALVTTTLFYLFSDNPTAAAYLLMVPYIGLGALLALLGVVLYARLSQPRLLLRALKQGRNADKVLGWRRVVIDAEGIRSTSEFSSSLYLWHGIDRIATTPDHAFFYISTITAVVVPRAVFRDDGAFKEFVDAARRYYRIGRVGGNAADDASIPTVLPVGDESGASEGIVPKDVRRSFRDRPGV